MVVDLDIVCQNPKQHHTTLRKEFATVLVPVVGIELDDGVLSPELIIQRVAIAPEEHAYYVTVSHREGENMDRCEGIRREYEKNGWAIPRIK